MKEIVIIGSGFGGIFTYLKLKKYNPIIISASTKFNKLKKINERENLNINKFFSEKTKSFGSLKFDLLSKTKLHDRISLGGNSNIWGGFIDISNLNKEFIRLCEINNLKLSILDLKKNGYASNNNNIRQIRTNTDSIFNANNLCKNIYEGLLYSFSIEKNFVKLIVYDKNNNINVIKSRKVILCINLPQLLDLLFRSQMLENRSIFEISEYEHFFELSFKKKFKNYNYKKNLVIKYDAVRSFKHFLGYQKSLDNFFLNFPIYINQNFLNNKRKLTLELRGQSVVQKSKNIKFGESIHYCNLIINNKNIDNFLGNISNNIFGLSTPFVNQKLPGPISNDIINKIYSKIN